MTRSNPISNCILKYIHFLKQKRLTWWKVFTIFCRRWKRFQSLVSEGRSRHYSWLPWHMHDCWVYNELAMSWQWICTRVIRYSDKLATAEQNNTVTIWCHFLHRIIYQWICLDRTFAVLWKNELCLSIFLGVGWPEDVPEPSHGRFFREKFCSTYVVLKDLLFNSQQSYFRISD